MPYLRRIVSLRWSIYRALGVLWYTNHGRSPAVVVMMNLQYGRSSLFCEDPIFSAICFWVSTVLDNRGFLIVLANCSAATVLSAKFALWTDRNTVRCPVADFSSTDQLAFYGVWASPFKLLSNQPTRSATGYNHCFRAITKLTRQIPDSVGLVITLAQEKLQSTKLEEGLCTE